MISNGSQGNLCFTKGKLEGSNGGITGTDLICSRGKIPLEVHEVTGFGLDGALEIQKFSDDVLPLPVALCFQPPNPLLPSGKLLARSGLRLAFQGCKGLIRHLDDPMLPKKSVYRRPKSSLRRPEMIPSSSVIRQSFSTIWAFMDFGLVAGGPGVGLEVDSRHSRRHWGCRRLYDRAWPGWPDALMPAVVWGVACLKRDFVYCIRLGIRVRACWINLEHTQAVETLRKSMRSRIKVVTYDVTRVTNGTLTCMIEQNIIFGYVKLFFNLFTCELICKNGTDPTCEPNTDKAAALGSSDAGPHSLLHQWRTSSRFSLNPPSRLFLSQSSRSLRFLFLHWTNSAWDSVLESSPEGVIIEVQQWMNHISLSTIGLAGFSHDFGMLSGKPSNIATVIDSIGSKPLIVHTVVFLLSFIAPIFNNIPTGHRSKLYLLTKTMRGLGTNFLATTGNSGINDKSVVRLLASAQNISQEEVVAQINVLLIAGYETTAISLTQPVKGYVLIGKLPWRQKWIEQARLGPCSSQLTSTDLYIRNMEHLDLPEAIGILPYMVSQSQLGAAQAQTSLFNPFLPPRYLSHYSPLVVLSTSGLEKNHKKAKRNQALLARAGKITDNYQEPSGSTGDLSQSRINDSGDNLSNRAGNASDNQLAVPGNHRDLPSLAPAGQISHNDFASTLSTISPSQSGVDTTGITGRNAEHVGRIAPSDSVRASGQDDSRVVSELAVKAKKKDPRPTVEAVTDDEDIAPSRRSSVPSKATKMCIAAARSLAERPEVSDAGSNPRPNNWDDINLRLAADALTCECGKNESNSVYQRRVATWKRNERQLHVGREADDLALAEELQVCEVLESEDFALATVIEAKQRSNARQARVQAVTGQ
ncbi:hypothetical protein B0H17DRAFT_1295743 [Mycena rosella]|uniref:Uncharacterized protein n=1 Tax=Mycena rosella TaxID=1033263 RepID=A0AAD7DH61_MYCRO|nr:hypothetical protein B0H17DRAFT_1295743 [Mycena rosella]